ncbi:chemotaxis-specific protein-glutamate methyltransferase CheB [Opitutus terrae]|uniref:Protein-glutamate methylesterase/protein-glutamine glutaminase n=1 Tax=Opitutus terrae (strain DSM 11246 / JCM 15787 / PB90-1) TaxID=452637 RepID=B1ZY73_OPITP|nr:chemotaxis-specific protein-glutamate methyltransferase CheB [Opitutus terrae]ACB76219.1 response regulator receiver modulated CheB methylesterase [Opitutus terrae PB90-1]
MTTTGPIRVLIVDDSAFARKVVREILSDGSGVEVVGSARDGEEALELTAKLSPDVIICDLRMPRMDGVHFVRTQMGVRPLPIMILSAVAQDADEVVEALNAGAIDVVQKPTALATDDLRMVREELIQKVRGAVTAPVENLARAPAASHAVAAPERVAKAKIVVVGISTGGPQALRRMVPLLPHGFPVPVAIVLHMPIGYTALYAEKLNEICMLTVKEAAEGDVLVPGRVLIAPAGRHLAFRRTPTGEVVAQLRVQPLEKLHRPSADVLFRSAAEVYGGAVVAVVMTGMGDDGTEGAAWVKAQGGTVLTEAEQSCVIYGMPRAVVEAGLSDLVVPLDDMAQAITSQI